MSEIATIILSMTAFFVMFGIGSFIGSWIGIKMLKRRYE